MPEQPSRPRNPYIAGNPVGNSRAFVGRGDILRAVHRVLRDPERHGVVLYGQRRIGKTSILQHLVTSLRSEASGAYRPVYFDLQDKAKWPLGDVLVDQARGIAAALGLQAPLAEGDPAVWFRATWLPSVLAGLPAETSLVILFDEFDVLADVRSEHAASALFPYLRQLLDESRGRVRFIFVIGRNIDDLANIAHALFKSLPAERVGLFAHEDAEAVMRMSEANGSMTWDTAAIEAAWALTSGHPFLLQQLCWELWERLHDDTRAEAQATAKDVEQAASRTLDSARNIFEWIWKGLPPAERVVASALAGAGARAISQDALEHLLHESGVRVVIRELRDAPQILEDWDLIEPAEGGYRFRVELLRRWIAKTKPLNRVQKDLDYIEPIAENLYRAGEGHYKAGELNAATGLFRQALSINPNHVRASELLADVLIARRHWFEAQRLLEQLHEHNPAAAKARLVQVWMELATAAENDDHRLALLEQVLKVQKHPAAEAARRRIWVERGDRARSAGNLEDAVAAYQEAGALELEKAARDDLQHGGLDIGLKAVEMLERQEEHTAAYERLRKLAELFPNVKDWGLDLARFERAAHLDGAYRRGVDARARGEREIALRALLDVIGREPAYRDATAQFHCLVTGIDADKLVLEVVREREVRVEAEHEANREKEARVEAEREASREKEARVEAEREASREKEARVEAEQRADKRIKARMLVMGSVGAAFAVAFAVTCIVIYVQLQSAEDQWAEAAHQSRIVGTALAATSAELDRTQMRIHALQERFDKETDRRKHLLEKGLLEVEVISLSVSVRSKESGCVSGAMYDPENLPANRTCYVTFHVMLRNNAAEMKPPEGLLCVRYVSPDGTTIVGAASYSSPQGSLCSMGIPLNVPDTVRHASEEINIDTERFRVSDGMGRDDGMFYLGNVGINRVEIWWQNKKIGEATFRIVPSSSP